MTSRKWSFNSSTASATPNCRASTSKQPTTYLTRVGTSLEACTLWLSRWRTWSSRKRTPKWMRPILKKTFIKLVNGWPTWWRTKLTLRRLKRRPNERSSSQRRSCSRMARSCETCLISTWITAYSSEAPPLRPNKPAWSDWAKIFWTSTCSPRRRMRMCQHLLTLSDPSSSTQRGLTKCPLVCTCSSETFTAKITRKTAE